MTNDELIAMLSPVLDEILATQDPSQHYLTDVQIRLERLQMNNRLEISSYVFRDRVTAPSLPELVAKVKTLDPKGAKIAALQLEIARQQKELAILKGELKQVENGRVSA